MRRSQLYLFQAGIIVSLFFLVSADVAFAIDRQPNPDYHARRDALAKKTAGVVVLFASSESDGPYELYGFRQDDYFFYLPGLSEQASALLIATAPEANGDAPARAYSEILFLPPRNSIQEKWTGPKLGPENPEAPRVTGFDRVEDMGQLPNEVARFGSGARPSIYTDVASQGETSPSTQPLAFLKRLSAYLFFQDVKPMLSSLRTSKD